MTDTEGSKVNAKVLERFNVFYSLTPQGKDLESVRDARWYTKDEITDFTQVKSIKVTLKDGSEIRGKEEVAFITKNRIPFVPTLENFLKANNTIAISRNGVNYLEANKAVASNIQYYVKGTVFADREKNKNNERDGIKSSTERGLKGYTVQLVGEDGNVVVSRYDNKEITATTDENGNYKLPVYDRGNYKLRVLKKGVKEKFTVANIQSKQDKDDRVIANDIEVTQENYGETSNFTLNPGSFYAIKDVGIILENGEIHITKTNQDGEKLQFIVFRLFKDGNLVKTEITNQDGKIHFGELPFGKYVLKEISNTANEKYVLMEDKEITVDENSDVVEVNITNQIKKGSVKVIKVDAEDSGKKLDGVVFELKQGDKVVATGTTVNGEYVFKDVVYGDYQLVEKTTLENYNLNTTPVEVQVREQGKEVEKTIANQIKKGHVEFKKVDAETGKAVVGVTFTLNQNGEEKYTTISNDQGVVRFENVIYGDYTLVEKATLENYNLSSETRTVQVREHGTTVQFDNFINKKIYGSIQLKKVDQETQEALSGVEFTLTKPDGTKMSALSNKEGRVVFERLAYGEYTITETKSLEGYVKKSDTYTVKVKKDGEVYDIGKVENRKITGSILLKKVDSKTKQALANVEFTLYANGKEVTKARSNEQGVVRFDHVKYGTYTIKETEALQGYKKSDQDLSATISENEAVIDLGTIENKKILKPAIDTSDASSSSLYMIMMMLVCTLYFVKFNRK